MSLLDRIRSLFGRPTPAMLLVSPEDLDSYASAFAEWQASNPKTLDGFEATWETEALDPEVRPDGTAVLPIRGLIVQGVPGVIEVLGWATDPNRIASQLATLDARSDVRAIELQIDSPGGYVGGVERAARALAAVNKPTTAIVSGVMASAAYWIGSSANTILAEDETATIGSIGVYSLVRDYSTMLEKAGVATYLFASGDLKGAFAGAKPTDVHLAAEQKHVNELAALFTSTVFKARGIEDESVRAEISRGGAYLARTALALGLIDGILSSSSQTTETPEGIKDPVPALATVEVEEEQIMTVDDFIAGLSADQKTELVAKLSADTVPADSIPLADRADVPEDVKARLLAVEAELAAAHEASEVARYGTEAEAFGNLPGIATDELAGALRAADSAGCGESVRKLLTAAKRLTDQSPMLRTVGANRNGAASDDVETQIRKVMTERGCNRAAAVVIVAEQDRQKISVR